MTKEKVEQAVRSYIGLLSKSATTAYRDSSHPNYPHLLWMCDMVLEFLAADRTEKAMRWLGFIQGAMWWAGIRTVGEMKQDNMSLSDEALDPKRI